MMKDELGLLKLYFAHIDKSQKEKEEAYKPAVFTALKGQSVYLFRFDKKGKRVLALPVENEVEKEEKKESSLQSLKQEGAHDHSSNTQKEFKMEIET